MKKLLILFLLFGIIITSSGQKKRISELYIGMVHGLNFSTVSFNPKEEIKLLPGYSGGFNIIYKSQPYVGVKIEFNYAQKGWELNLDSTQSYKRVMNYFEIPFTTHIMLGKKKSKYLIDLGPYFGYMLSENENVDTIYTFKEFYSLKIQNDFDFGYCFGLGYQFNSKFGDFGIEVKYSNSLTNIFIPSEKLHYFSSRNQTLTTRFIYTIQIF